LLKIICNLKKCTLIPVAAIAMVSVLILGSSISCNRLVLQNEEGTVSTLAGIFPEATYYYYDEETGIYNVYDGSKNKIGNAFYAEGIGYGGRITVLVGLEDAETIKGIEVSPNNEQRQIGWGVSEELDFTPLIEQFVGLKVNDCYLKKEGGAVDGVSGATISSTALINIVREAALEKAASII
jgi:Na+-translocating ferredoxin:NAD+ oxidoreductase subunit G